MPRRKKKKIIKTKASCTSCSKEHYVEDRERVIIHEVIDGKVFLARTVCPYCKKEGYTELD